ncbi:MAG: hypothetical protein H7Z40_04395 [Phycisphaerae bacterium]|nr:hypothetical protein [Gemmatimonadaceae bacterium]
MTNRARSAAMTLFACLAPLLGGCSDAADSLEPPTGSTPGVDVSQRIAAARTTAERPTGLCADIQPFYWEVGDATARLGSGSVNRRGSATTYTAQTQMSIASASKWVYGAYVAERRGGSLTAEDIQFLTFRSGYTNFAFSGCENDDTVASCVARSTNGVLTPGNIGKFAYDGAHMQKHASLIAPGMGIGQMNNVALATEIRRVLGADIGLTYTQPQLAGGIRSSAADYAVLLRKVLAGHLRIGALLGTSATCTNPATCPTAINTPIGGSVNWHYSIGHWVEDDAPFGDGAFSSAGAFGFYPWINARKSLYGIVARVSLAGGGEASALCGARIRKAWETGVAQ